MPYIKKERRMEIGGGSLPETSGELNYKITMDILRYVSVKGISYATFNDVLGALEGCKLEFNRRVISRYEDSKIYENEDLYDNLIFKLMEIDSDIHNKKGLHD